MLIFKYLILFAFDLKLTPLIFRQFSQIEGTL